MHIGFNMWVLMDIGPMVEELYGSARYFFLFVVTGAAGYVVSSLFGHLSVGASGSLLGLIGVLLAATTGRKSLAAQALRSALIRWLIYIGVLGFMFSGTDNAAHAGGLAAGYLLGRVMADRLPADVSERKRAEFAGMDRGNRRRREFRLHGFELFAEYVGQASACRLGLAAQPLLAV